jgi:molecular chaperone GrpE
MMGDEHQVETVEELLEDPQADEIIQSGLDIDVSSETAPAADAPVGSALDEETTDYEAAFLELRSAYASKERECEALKAQTEDSKGQYLRLAADFENFRRRNNQEREGLEVQIKISTLTELLSVVDNFERARSQLKTQTEGEVAIQNSYQGIYKDMVARLKKIGVAPMRAEGQEFDPNLHEALLRQPTADHPEGIVIDQLVRGYMMGDRVLRHAQVRVAAAPEDDEETATEG